jgi:hypothetical protein
MAALGIKPSPDNECRFEACHSIYSALASSIYDQVMEKFKIPFEKAKNPTTGPVVFCKDAKETHYKYADAALKIYDPYESYQLPNSHGNCLFFALYTAFYDSKTGPPLPKLYNLKENGLIGEVQSVDDPTIMFLKVLPGKEQLAYKCFVHNDFAIFKWVFETLKIHEDPGFKAEWDSMPRRQRTHYGIPVGYTFKEYIDEFESLMSKKESHLMTLDQILNWDIESKKIPDYENSGIEGGNGVLNKDDYEISPGDQLRGGRRKLRKTRKRL